MDSEELMQHMCSPVIKALEEALEVMEGSETLQVICLARVLRKFIMESYNPEEQMMRAQVLLHGVKPVFD